MALKRYGAQLADRISAVSTLTAEMRADVEAGGERLAAAYMVETIPSPTSIGSPGQFMLAGDYLYICVAPDTWARIPAETSW